MGRVSRVYGFRVSERGPHIFVKPRAPVDGVPQSWAPAFAEVPAAIRIAAPIFGVKARPPQDQGLYEDVSLSPLFLLCLKISRTGGGHSGSSEVGGSEFLTPA